MCGWERGTRSLRLETGSIKRECRENNRSVFSFGYFDCEIAAFHEYSDVACYIIQKSVHRAVEHSDVKCFVWHDTLKARGNPGSSTHVQNLTASVACLVPVKTSLLCVVCMDAWTHADCHKAHVSFCCPSLIT